ncbi:PH domain-containing protein [Haloarcula salinisoli]|uniref:PH domain-containing protein n=1 Tax=Haloarcula salinisoli TaxID=2487746 RepID=A0A8J7YBU4_9EURY|nr:PH domain-containing protein [Halomicroarcula salinisoli]MBX0302557.1 PH domain-containing protein [Halomicroarcula salinisoli]
MSGNAGSYDWLTLDPDEEVLWSGKPASETMYGAYLTGIPLIIFFGLGLVIIVGAYLNRENTDYVITDKSVYKKTGVLSRSVSEVEYEKVQNTSFSAGVVGRSLGYGNVEISTAGGAGVEMRLRGVNDPQEVQKQLSRRVKEVQGGRDRGDGETKPDVLEEILAELRAIRIAAEGGSSRERPDSGAGAHDRDDSGTSDWNTDRR